MTACQSKLSTFSHPSASFRLAFFALVVSPLTLHAAPPFLVVLGIAQDGGFPQAGCQKLCCKAVWSDFARRKFVSSLAVVDPDSGQRWLFDATPDFKEQMHLLDRFAPRKPGQAVLDGVFLTHAHIGHYTGLMHLGREVMGADTVKVYAMPRMREFLSSNGPWDQLIRLEQIHLQRIANVAPVRLNERITVTPIKVPHRDEYSETVGFKITSGNSSAIFIPDIDKWERWDASIEEVIAEANIAFLDGTFYGSDEINGRDISEIPHPFISESIKRFSALPIAEREKVHFIHLNHTNPCLQSESAESNKARLLKMQIAQQGFRWEFSD